MPQISLDDILKVLDDKVMWVVGRNTGMVSTPAPIGRAPTTGGISFCTAPPESAVSAINESRAEIIVCRADIVNGQIDAAGKTVIGVDHPRRCFIRVVASLFAPKTEEGIHPTAVIHPDARLGKGIHVGPLASVGACSIGDGSTIHGRVHVGDGTVIGRNVVIHPGTVIGTDGFGYERNEDGVLEKFPHIGNVVIEDDVEIGANSCIDRGTLGDTVVGRGTKIDNLVHIAHNVTIGCDSVITAATMIAGSATIGDSSWIAPASAVNNKITIGRNSLVGIGSVVVRDVPDDVFVAGVPARAVPNRGSPK